MVSPKSFELAEFTEFAEFANFAELSSRDGGCICRTESPFDTRAQGQDDGILHKLPQQNHFHSAFDHELEVD